MSYCNTNIENFVGVGQYGIPQIQPVYDLPIHKWVEFAKIQRNYADKSDTMIHFFTDDTVFERLWNHPNKYIIPLSRYGGMLSPDFSMYTEMPKAVQIYNHYRKHWLAAYYQQNGFTVIPTIGWVDEDSFDWCFDGEPEGSIVAVSNVGGVRNPESSRLFKLGYEEMIRRLHPKEILFYAKSFKAENYGSNVRRIMYGHGYTIEVPNDLG